MCSRTPAFLARMEACFGGPWARPPSSDSISSPSSPPSPCRQVPGQFGALSARPQLCSHHTTRLQDPLIPERRRPPAATPRAPPPAPDNTDLLSVSLELPFLDTSYTWNHITRGLWSGLFYGAVFSAFTPVVASVRA